MALFTQMATKEKLRARVAIDGPTGSGKTYTALQWARILAGPDGEIGCVDTENRSAAYYAPTPGVEINRVNWWDPPYEFRHLPVSAPYSPIWLRDVIVAAPDELGENGVLLIDSLTHFWSGEGGTLDIVDNAATRGNSFTGWKEGTPAQRAMLDAIIHCRCHVIVTMRSKMEFVLDEIVKDGRKISVPRKIGMAPEQRAGVEYEFTVVGDMDLEHRLVISKSRCDAIADVVAPKGRSADPAQTFATWLGSGVTRISDEERRMLARQLNRIGNESDLNAMREALQGKYGRSTEITTDAYPEVLAWLTARVDQMTGTVEQPVSAAGPVPADAEVPRGTSDDEDTPIDETLDLGDALAGDGPAVSGPYAADAEAAADGMFDDGPINPYAEDPRDLSATPPAATRRARR